MIERTSREHVLKILKENHNNWKILDIGCNIAPVEFAQTVADVQNFSSLFNLSSLDKGDYTIRVTSNNKSTAKTYTIK